MSAPDQWPLWEVFVRSKNGLSHKHSGSLHAPDAEMALKNARDVYTRRSEGTSIWVVLSSNIVASAPYAKEVLEELRGAGLRARLDVQRESLSKRLAAYHRLGIPYQLVLGRREAQQRRVSIRHKGQREVALYEGLALLQAECASPI